MVEGSGYIEEGLPGCTGSDDSQQNAPSLVSGEILKEHGGLRDALEFLLPFADISHGVLFVFSKKFKGQIAVAGGSTIVAARDERTGTTGLAALKAILAYTRGFYAFRQVDAEVLAEFGPALEIPIADLVDAPVGKEAGVWAEESLLARLERIVPGGALAAGTAELSAGSKDATGARRFARQLGEGRLYIKVSAPVPAPAAIDMASLPIDRLFEAESVADVPELGAVAVPVASAPAVAEPAALESGVEAPAEPPALRPGSKAADVRNWFGQPGYVEKLDKETASRLRDRTARLSSAIPSVNLVGVIVLALAAALAVVAFLQYRNFEHGQLIKMGKEYLKEKHFELALKRFDAAAQIRPDSAAAHYYKGLSLLRLNKPGQAAQQFDRCLSLDGERPLPFLTRAQANIALGEFDGAVSDSTKALELDPSLIKAYLVRARGYLGKKQAAQARKDLDKVNLLNCPQGLKLEYYDLLCDTLAGEGKYKSAARQLTKVIGAEPGLVSAYLKRAGLFMHLSRWGDAIDDYTHALRRQPHDGSIFSKRGLAYKRAGKLQQAIADFDRALTYLPDSIEALMNRGRCHMELRNLGQAKYDFERVLALDKGNEEAGKMVKEIASGLERLRHATTAVTTASANDATAGLPGDAKELSMLGYNSMKAGNYRLAVQALSKAVKVSPNDANLRRYLAHALIASGQRSFAMQQLKALLSLEPSAIADRVRLVRLLMEAGLYQEAMAICDAGALIGGSETELEELKKVRVQAEIEMRGQMNDSSTSQPTPSWKIPGA